MQDWYSSFYWRIATSFVVLVLVVLLGQSLMVSYMAARRDGPFAPGDPVTMATAIAADLGAALTRQPDVDLDAEMRRVSGDGQPRAFLVMRDGRAAGGSGRPLSDAIRRQVDAALRGRRPETRPGDAPTGPVVTAPVQVAGELRGMVVLPPPPPRGMFSDVWRLLSLPGTIVLLVMAAVAAVVIFGPARRRLHELERAVERFGTGELTTRAPETGRDEIARVARAFNSMAAELSVRGEALQQSDRLRRQMLADVSHELRTPLTAMRGFLDTLAMPDVALDPATRARYLETIRSETSRLERIVTDLLELAKHENAAASLAPRVFALERVLGHVLSRHERDAQDAGVTLSTHIDDNADQLFADPDRIEQVLVNLVANALRHTPKGGTIEVRAAASPAAYRLTVVDSGEGIAPEHHGRVFERFYKADAARTGGFGGSGLGLSIVKVIVERHGGTVSVSSRPGRTEFIVSLPHAGA